MPNRFVAIQPGTSPEQQLAMINKNFGELDAESATKLFYDVNGTPSISIGVQQDRTSRIRVAKPGKDVTTATDADLAFNSAQNVFKIVADSTVSCTAPAHTNNTTTIAHGLSYKPAVIAFLEAGIAVGARMPLPTWTSLTRDDVNNVIVFRTWINVEVDATNLYIRYFNSLATVDGPCIVHYYLLQETAA